MALSHLAQRAVSGFNGGDPSKYPGAFPPPHGVTPNLVNPPDAGRQGGIAGLTVCLALATILFVVRVYVKLRITRRLLLEDLACCIAWAMVVLFTATSAMMIHYGLGHHSWDVPVDEYANLLKWLYITSIVYEPAAFFTKAALLLLLARIFAVKTAVSRSIYAFIIFLLVVYIPIFAVKIALCHPTAAFWDPTVDGSCLNLRKILIIDVAFAIATDSAISIIPLPLIWKLRMSWRRKVKIMILLGAGGVATAVTIYRLVKLTQYVDSSDVASDFVLLDVLTLLELTIGLICSCLPALNILIEYSRRPPSDANSPRSRSRWGGRSSRRLTGGVTWHWLESYSTPEENRTTTKNVTPPPKARRNTRNTQTSARTDFDVQLAMLSGRDISDAGYSDGSVRDSNEEQMADAWFNSDRATACHGRREGWLHAASQNSSRLSIPHRGDGESERTDESKQSKAISDQLAEMSGNRPWGYIWDGRRNSEVKPS